MNVLIGAAGTVVILTGIRATASLLIPLVLALFLSLITFPLVRWLQMRHVPRVVAVAMTMLAVLATLIGPSLLIVTAVRQFATAVPGYEARLRQVVASMFEWLRGHSIDTTSLSALVDPAQVLNLMVTMLSGVATLLSTAFLVVVIAAFMLFEAAHILDRRHNVLGAEPREHLRRIAGDLQNWLWVKTIISVATGLAAGVWTALLGIDFALLWGLTAFLLNYVPNFGSLVAAVPPVLLALIQFGPVHGAVVLLGYVGINALFGSVLEPYLMGRRIGLSPLVVLLSVIIWGWLWGVGGMLLSVPITVAIKIVLEHSPDDLQWIAQLIEGDTGERI